MYLSRLEIDTKKPRTCLAMANRNPIHGAVERCFTGERKRNLWRIDELGGSTYLLIVSEDRPDLSGISAQFGVQGTEMIKDYETLLKRCVPGSHWRFRLVAYPTYAVKEKGSKRGKHQNMFGVQNQKKWLIKKADMNGFSISENSFDVTKVEWANVRRYKGPGDGASLNAVTFEGFLTVTDQKRFVNTLRNGIGRGKAFGLGMLTVMSVR